MLNIFLYDNISTTDTLVLATRTRGDTDMNDNDQYYLIKKKAVPEVLLKVVEAKKILEKNITKMKI